MICNTKKYFFHNSKSGSTTFKQTSNVDTRVDKMLIDTMVIQQWTVLTLVCFELVILRVKKQRSAF